MASSSSSSSDEKKEESLIDFASVAAWLKETPRLWMLELLKSMNSVEWWPCWIGLAGFWLVYLFNQGLGYQRPPNFREWTYNPFVSLEDASNVGLAGILIWVIASLVLAMYLLAVFPPDDERHRPPMPPQDPTNSINDWGNFTLGFSMVLLPLAAVSKILAHQTSLLHWHIGDSIWAILFGILLSNLIPGMRFKKDCPVWIRAACQTELLISVSLVLLMIDTHELVPLLGRAFLVSWIDTPLLFVLCSWLGWRLFRLTMVSSIITSGVTLICGSSAGIALAKSLQLTEKDAAIPIAISSILSVPQIVMLPWLISRAARSALPFLRVPEAAGALLGGTIDSTGTVIAAADVFHDSEILAAAAVIKMFQNVLIAPLTLLLVFLANHPTSQKFIFPPQEITVSSESDEEHPADQQQSIINRRSSSSYESISQFRTDESSAQNEEEEEEEDATDEDNYDERIHSVSDPFIFPSETQASPPSREEETKSHWTLEDVRQLLISVGTTAQLLWARFPKFVVGFLFSALLFNLTVPHEDRAVFQTFTFVLSEWYSTCSFVSIGLGIRLFEMKDSVSQHLTLVAFYVVVQGLDILATLGFTAAAKFPAHSPSLPE